jgi:hypothetical protein
MSVTPIRTAKSMRMRWAGILHAWNMINAYGVFMAKSEGRFSALFLNILNLRSYRNAGDQVSSQYKTGGNTVVLFF